jgi:hypothetical protein
MIIEKNATGYPKVFFFFLILVSTASSFLVEGEHCFCQKEKGGFHNCR